MHAFLARRLTLVVITAGAVLAAGSTTATARSAAPGPSGKRGPQVTAPPAGAPVVTPAERLANEIAGLGRTTYADVFADLKVRPGAVTLYVTDTARGRRLAAAGVSALPAGLRRLATPDIRLSPYTKRQLRAGAGRIWAQAPGWSRSGVTVYEVALRPGGAGLTVRTNAAPRAAALAMKTPRAFTAGGVRPEDVAFERGSAGRSLDGRFDDTPPFAGGAAIHYTILNCSSAFGVNQTGRNYLVSAAHCYAVGDPISTRNGNRPIGNVTGRATGNDATTIETNTWSGVYTAGDSWTHYRDSGWTFGGTVCQSGVVTDNVCGLTYREESSWPVPPRFGSEEPTGTAYGVKVCAPPNQAAGREGDSGGPVYTWWNDGKVQSRGIVSYGFDRLGETESFNCMGFTETRQMLTDWSQGAAPMTLLTDRTGDPKHFVTTFTGASGYNGIAPYGPVQGVLNQGRNYVYCREWGVEVRNGSAFNHYWLKTDLDTTNPGQRGRGAWVSAYYLKGQGNDEAKDENGNELPNC